MENKAKFLADENVSKSLVKALREQGYDVKDIKEEKLFGISDEKIIEIAEKENRIIITHDKDFLEISKRNKNIQTGIIAIRLSNQKPQKVIEKILPIINPKTLEKLKNSIAIITENHIEIIKQF